MTRFDCCCLSGQDTGRYGSEFDEVEDWPWGLELLSEGHGFVGVLV